MLEGEIISFEHIALEMSMGGAGEIAGKQLTK